MPRRVDRAERAVSIAEAAWRVAARDGVRTLSVRTVAAEANLATASLRRAFPTQSSLLTFAMELVDQRATVRIRTLPRSGELRQDIPAILREVLPLDSARRTEMEVFLVIGTAALSDEALRPVYDAVNEHLGELVRGCVDGLRSAGLLGDGRSPELEAARLHALVDGLALHLVRSPPEAPTRWATDVLDGHLDQLTQSIDVLPRRQLRPAERAVRPPVREAGR